MKKVYLFIGLALSALVVGCSSSEKTETGGDDSAGSVTVRVTATIANEGLSWTEGTTVAVNGEESSSAVVTEDGATATFDVKKVSAPLKVVAPFGAYEEVGDIITVPDTQQYVADGYDASAFVLLGYTQDVTEADESDIEYASVEMNAACGIVKLPVVIADGSATIKTLSLTSTNGEAVAGDWSVDFKTGSVSAEKSYSTITLDCGDSGVALDATAVDFRFVLPAGSYKGIIIEATDSQDRTFVYDYTDTVVVDAGLETELAQMTYQIVEKADATLSITIAEPSITWATGDQVVVNGVLSSEVSDDAGKSTASFDLAQVAYPYTVLYPRELYTTSGRLRFYNEQRLLKNEFDREALAMVGYSQSTNVTLHNVCGLIKIPVTNNYETDVVTLQKVCLTSNDGSALAGKYNINYRNATISQISAVDNLTLVAEDGNGIVIPVGETVYVYAVVPEGKFPQGLTLDVYTDVSNKLGIVCTAAGGLNVTRGVETELETVEYTDVKVSQITTAEEFVALIGALNRGRSDRFKNDDGEIVLGGDIDLTGIEVDQIAELADVFDGKGFALKNLTATSALFLKNSGTIKNLVLDGCNIVSLVGTNSYTVDNITVKSSKLSNSFIQSNTTDATVSNVTLDADNDLEFAAPTSAWNFGMVCGANYGTVTKCKSSIVYQKTIASTPSGSGCNFGGIVGYSTGLVSECTFDGKFEMVITSPTKSVVNTFGGVVAKMSGSADKIMVQNCTNSGSVFVNYVSAASFYTGGVVGGTPSAAKAPGNYGIIDNCTNTGNVGMIYDNGGTGAYPLCGGVVGYLEGYIQHCTNRGDVSLECKSTANAWTCAKHGGVAGVVTRGAIDCHNYGTVTVVSGLFAGGTAGANGAANSNLCCWGGVIGGAGPYTPDNSCKFENCTNNTTLDIRPGTTTGSPQFTYGGVFGFLSGSAVDCVNNSDVSVNGSTYILNFGGVAGTTDGNVTNCRNTGRLYCDDSNVSGTSDASKKRHYVRFGGIVGAASYTVATTISDSVNSGALVVSTGQETSTNTSYVGGIYGTSLKDVTTENCTNTGSLSTPSFDNISKGNIGGPDNDL